MKPLPASNLETLQDAPGAFPASEHTLGARAIDCTPSRNAAKRTHEPLPT